MDSARPRLFEVAAPYLDRILGFLGLSFLGRSFLGRGLVGSSLFGRRLGRRVCGRRGFVRRQLQYDTNTPFKRLSRNEGRFNRSLWVLRTEIMGGLTLISEPKGFWVSEIEICCFWISSIFSVCARSWFLPDKIDWLLSMKLL